VLFTFWKGFRSLCQIIFHFWDRLLQLENGFFLSSHLIEICWLVSLLIRLGFSFWLWNFVIFGIFIDVDEILLELWWVWDGLDLHQWFWSFFCWFLLGLDLFVFSFLWCFNFFIFLLLCLWLFCLLNSYWGLSCSRGLSLSRGSWCLCLNWNRGDNSWSNIFLDLWLSCVLLLSYKICGTNYRTCCYLWGSLRCWLSSFNFWLNWSSLWKNWGSNWSSGSYRSWCWSCYWGRLNCSNLLNRSLSLNRCLCSNLRNWRNFQGFFNWNFNWDFFYWFRCNFRLCLC